MAMNRPIRRGLVWGGVAVVALVLVGWFSRNIIATAVTRSVATRLLGVPVEVDAVRLDAFGLAVEVEGVRVANPAGWGAPRALEIGQLGIRVSSESSTQRLVVDDITLRTMKVWFIRDGLDNNISALVRNLSGPQDDANATKPEPAGPGTELLIRRLALADVEVRYAERSSAGGDVPVVARLDTVEVRDINARTAGKDLAEQLVGQVFEASVVAVISGAGGKLPAEVGKAVSGAVEAGGLLGTQAIGAIGDAAKGAGKAVGEAVGGFLKGIEGAVGGNKPGSK
ncbi:MAG: hypothetical protein FJ260_01090 [Planctomycetes bacterium]|nr:hypothetical protein [Planctomycetota bacterium]